MFLEEFKKLKLRLTAFRILAICLPLASTGLASLGCLQKVPGPVSPYTLCYGASYVCDRMRGPATPEETRMYHTLVVAPQFQAIFTVGHSCRNSRNCCRRAVGTMAVGARPGKLFRSELPLE
jgi:hypothetical protein